ncbi:TlpA family protein disulfide reductase [Vulgatibacter incomptus]|uniref:Thiol:disulfide oxidoreductase n=1 Tax=Vulgatibacter incomptus TaxID=1391653 RepID=A0A0K1PH77_9BACT|nr:TlpA disulfide reductase family protein [Vulgatibacter incomptus]AKU92893.1 thiol:disulfide oxidoreductase [Vulgatibacter incomptus]
METETKSGAPASPVRRKPRWKRLAGEVAFALLVFAAITAWQGRNLVASGGPAPDFVLRDLQGNPHRLADLAGRKVLLYFWAPWCGVCKAAAPNVASIAKSGGADVLSVALDYRSRDEVERVAAEHGIPGPVLLGDERIARDFAVNVYPTFYVIGEDGTIRRSMIGYATWLGLKLRLLL